MLPHDLWLHFIFPANFQIKFFYSIYSVPGIIKQSQEYVELVGSLIMLSRNLHFISLVFIVFIFVFCSDSTKRGRKQ